MNVPREALSGKIIITDVYGNQLYSDEALVRQPVIKGFSPATIKAGGVITFAGTDVDLIKSITFGGGVVADSLFAQTETEFSVVVPRLAQTGTVTGTAYSLITTGTQDVLTMIVPTVSGATPVTDLTPETDITVTGTNLDLVKDVTFPNIAKNVELKSQSTTEIVVTMPEMAHSGRIVLNMDNNDTIGIEISTLKPTVTNITPNPANIGEVVVLAGTNLNLVTSVAIGEKVYDAENGLVIVSATNISLPELTLENETGNVVLTMFNGEEVTSDELTVLKPQYCYATEIPTSTTSGNALKIVAVNVEHLTGVLLDGSPAQYMVSGSMIFVLIPSSVNGEVSVSLVSDNGGPADYTVNVTRDADNEEIVLWEGMQNVGTGWDWNSNVVIEATKFANAGFGSKIKVTYTCDEGAATYYQLKFTNSSGAALTSYTVGRNEWDCAELAQGSTEYEFYINLADLAELQTGGMRVAGYAAIITKVSLVNYFNINTSVKDVSYVYFDFNDGTKNSWWGQANVNNQRSDDYWLYDGVENNPVLSLDGTPYFRGNNGSGMFFRNGANNMLLDGVTVEGWVVRFDVRVLRGSGAIRLELESGGTQYMAVVNIPNDKTVWRTVTVSLSEFKDGWGSGENSLPDLNIGEFGATDGGNGDTMELLIDNVRFERN